MKKLIIASLITYTLVGCATPVTEGQRVFITPTDSTHLANCEALGKVSATPDVTMLWNTNEQISEIKNRLRDETAKLYSEADTVAHTDFQIGLGQPTPMIMGIAFKCFK